MAKGIKRNSKLIILAINMLILGFIMILTTVAWISVNRDLGGKGISMEVSVSPILVICAKNGTYGEGTYSIEELGDHSGASILYNWSNEAKKLQPATHNWTLGTDTGLVYSSDPTKVSEKTGLSILKPDNSDLSIKKVPVYETGEQYYVDYVVYIASLYMEYNNIPHLNASFIETGNQLATDVNNAYKAASIDFYMEVVGLNETITASSSNYKGTLNLVDTTETVDVLSGVSNATIPLNTEGALAVLMRCYFDGALTYTDTTVTPNVTRTYVNSEALKTEKIGLNFKVKFIATGY